MIAFFRFWSGLLALILANIIPLWGIAMWHWSTTDLLFCFWIESAVTGIFTLLKLARYRDLFLMAFFPLHYGLFMLVHLIFLITGASIGFFGVDRVTDIGALLMNMGLFFLGSLGSHALSFFVNFLQGREWQKHQSSYYFILPYGRIVPMHLTIILGAIFGAGPFILYGIKMVVDIAGYCVEHLSKGLQLRGKLQKPAA